MFRCYFIKSGRISWGEDLKASTLAEAIELAWDLRQASLKSDKSPGIEIWQGASLLYQDVEEADQIQSSAPIPEFAVHRHTVKTAAISVAWRDSAMW